MSEDLFKRTRRKPEPCSQVAADQATAFWLTQSIGLEWKLIEPRWQALLLKMAHEVNMQLGREAIAHPIRQTAITVGRMKVELGRFHDRAPVLVFKESYDEETDKPYTMLASVEQIIDSRTFRDPQGLTSPVLCLDLP